MEEEETEEGVGQEELAEEVGAEVEVEDVHCAPTRIVNPLEIKSRTCTSLTKKDWKDESA